MRYAQKNLDKPDGMSFNEMRDIATFFIIAGSETTSSLLAGVVYYLLMHPAVLARLTNEIRGAFKSEVEITMTSVNGLSYLAAVISEGLRIYPPLPGSSWRLTPSSGCVVANRSVPGNMTVGLNQWAASHSSYNFTRPYDFVPERWLSHTQDGASKIGGEENEFKEDRKRAFQPFSVGPRNCVGRSLANVEARLVLARLIWGLICVFRRRVGIGWRGRGVGCFGVRRRL